MLSTLGMSLNNNCQKDYIENCSDKTKSKKGLNQMIVPEEVLKSEAADDAENSTSFISSYPNLTYHLEPS